MARRTNDDWERLVAAVLKREHLWQLFQEPSPSISSAESGTSYNSGLDLTYVNISSNDAVESSQKLEPIRHVEEKVLAILPDDDVNRIGISGAQGIENTAMAERIGEIVKEQILFDEVMMVAVGPQPNIEKIRSSLAEVLVKQRLRNVLVILDDACETLRLEDLGVSSCIGDKRCKAVFTSQKKDVEVETEDTKAIATDGQPFPDVPRFCTQICAMDKPSGYIEVPVIYMKTEPWQYMHQSLPNEEHAGNWIHMLLRRTEYLSLVGNNSSKLLFQEFKNLKKFKIRQCSTINHIFNSPNGVSFWVLESLDLADLTYLREICHGPLMVGSFGNLKELKLCEMPALLHLWKTPADQTLPLINLRSINIKNCKILPYLFTSSTARTLVQLEELRILFCGMMKEVFLKSNEEDGCISFPKLKKLILHSLPSLAFFCSGTDSMMFPRLQILSIRDLPKLREFASGESNSPVLLNHKVEFDNLRELYLHGIDDNIRQIWSLQVPASHFIKLEKLRIIACNKLNNLFSPSISIALVNLKELRIGDCLMMAEVVLNLEKENGRTLFPRLENLDLWQLRSLKFFCQWKQDLELPSLRHVNIINCPKMQTFTVGSLSTPSLENVKFENGVVETKDLNGAVWEHSRAKSQSEASSSKAR